MTRTPCAYQLAGLAALEATVEIAMRALVETYRELHREPRPDDSAEAVTAAPSVPTSLETVSLRYLCAEWRRMVPSECPSQPQFQVERPPLRRTHASGLRPA